MEIGDRIKHKREELGISQEELARKVGYKSRSSINKIETDGRGLPQSKIMLFAKALETTPSYLMGWEENTTYILDNLERIMLLKNISKFDLSQRSGISLSEIENIFKIGRAPISYLGPLTDALEVTSKYLTDFLPNEITLDKLQDQILTKTYTKMINLFLKLNSDGLHEAYKRVEELTYIPKYVNISKFNELNAANARTDIEIPNNTDSSDDDIMDSEDF